jgi:hypothetical protein
MDLPRQSPPPPPRYSNDPDVLQACLSLAGEPGPDWAIRALIGRNVEGGGRKFFLHLNLVSISFDY